MNLLLVVTNADNAGAPIHVRDLALRLCNLGHKVRVVFGEDGPIKDQLHNAGIATYCIPTLRSNINPWQDLISFKALTEIVRNTEPDVLHLHSSKAGFVGRMVAWHLGVPAVYTIHGWGFGPGRRNHIDLLVRLMEYFFKHLTRRYIAVSNADRLIGIKQLGIKSETIQTIYNGSGFEAISSWATSDRLILIMVARNDHQKDYTTLFKALANASFDEALLVGKGTDAPAFKQLARSILGHGVSKVKFLGVCNNVEHLLSEVNVMVLSSRFEGLPLSLIEGMSKGLVLLASNVGGVPELIEEGVNGWLFEPENNKVLAQHINNLYNNPSLRQRMGEESLKRFKAEFELDTMLKQTVEQYRKACS